VETQSAPASMKSQRRSRHPAVLTATLLVLLIQAASSWALGDELPGSVWPTLHGSPARAALAASRGPQRPSLFWKLSFVQYVNATFRSPVSMTDGSLITSVFASTPNRGSEARLLRAIPDGGAQLITRAAMLGDPALSAAGDLYVLAMVEGDYQLLIRPSQGEADPLSLPPTRPVFNSPAIGRDGSIFLALNGLVLGLTPKGEIRWGWAHPQYNDPTQPAPTVVGSPAIGPDGAVYAVFQDGIYAFEPDGGRLVWRSSYQFVDPDRPVDGPIVAPDGTLYVITRAPTSPEGDEGEAFLYSLRPNGSLNWRWPAGRGALQHPAIDHDGAIYLPVTGLRRPDDSVVGRLYVLNPDSTLRRPPSERPEEQGMIEAVVLDSAGVLYATASLGGDTLILGLRPDGADLFPPTPVPGRLRGPLGLPLPGLVSALTDRGVVLLADGPILELSMAVDAATARPAQTLTYTVRARNTGILPATNLLLRAGIPPVATYVAGSTLLDGRPVADLGESAPVLGGVNLGLLPPGAEAALTFQVALERVGANTLVTNSATARSDQLGTHTSNTVTTRTN
jgi:uncharacterized repeat protein (TIGR01451 family)